MENNKMDWSGLFDEITYDYESHYGIKYLGNGEYVLNKLYIKPREVTYKTEVWSIDETTYDKFVKFYNLMYDIEEV